LLSTPLVLNADPQSGEDLNLDDPNILKTLLFQINDLKSQLDYIKNKIEDKLEPKGERDEMLKYQECMPDSFIS
jgi:hypothetical protein